MRRVLIITIVVVILLGGGVLARHLIVGGTVISLQSNPLYDPVSASLQKAAASNYLPIEGKDYTISAVHYFDNNTWAVVSVVPVNADSVTLVLKKMGGSYQTVLQPTNDILSSNMNGFPTAVVNYLKGPGA